MICEKIHLLNQDCVLIQIIAGTPNFRTYLPLIPWTARYYKTLYTFWGNDSISRLLESLWFQAKLQPSISLTSIIFEPLLIDYYLLAQNKPALSCHFIFALWRMLRFRDKPALRYVKSKLEQYSSIVQLPKLIKQVKVGPKESLMQIRTRNAIMYLPWIIWPLPLWQQQFLDCYLLIRQLHDDIRDRNRDQKTKDKTIPLLYGIAYAKSLVNDLINAQTTLPLYYRKLLTLYRL